MRALSTKACDSKVAVASRLRRLNLVFMFEAHETDLLGEVGHVEGRWLLLRVLAGEKFVGCVNFVAVDCPEVSDA